jgi:dethiobiotin synthetase
MSVRSRRASTFFVTGTGTGVGKTLVTAGLLHTLRERELATIALKPVAAGATETEAGWRNDDALLLQRYQTVELSYQQINPVLLKAPLAPHIAARRESRRVSISQLVGYCRGALLQPADVALIEGAGGWRVPLNDAEHLSALPRALGVPVIMVVGLQLGCINQALLTAEAIVRDGLRLQGWVANAIDPDMAAVQDNIATLRSALPGACLGVVPWLSDPSPEQVAGFLDSTPLISAGLPPTD